MADVGVHVVSGLCFRPVHVQLGDRGLDQIVGPVPVRAEQDGKTPEGGFPRRHKVSEFGVAR